MFWRPTSVNWAVQFCSFILLFSAQNFELRQNFLLEVQAALQKSASSQNALLLLGEPGLGKSTILAKVTQLLPTWIPG